MTLGGVFFGVFVYTRCRVEKGAGVMAATCQRRLSPPLIALLVSNNLLLHSLHMHPEHLDATRRLVLIR